MASNFDFFKKIDKELYEIIIEAENLFRSTYYSQCVIQTRIFGEKMAKKISPSVSSTSTFDDILNNLKDSAQDEREKEFINDLFYIKKQGNACAHGEDITPDIALDTLKTAFEVAISYTFFKDKNTKTDNLLFDENLLVMEKKDNKLINEYLKRAGAKELKPTKEEILNKKQGEFLSQVTKQEDEENALEDKYSVKNPKQYNKDNKNLKKQKIKEKVKQAKKNLKENINKVPKKTKQAKSAKTQKEPKKKTSSKKKKQQQKNIKQLILFILFVIISLIFVSKFIF